jgi:osmotically-inducible protein OsmY
MRALPLILVPALLVAFAIPIAVAAEFADSDLQRNVEDQIRMSPIVGRFGIYAHVRDGVVSLSGRVDTLYQLWDAVDRAGKVRGVKSVDSRIELSPSSRHDGSIASDIVRRFQNVVALNSAELEVEVVQGKAVITGFVKDARLRNTAADEAADILGVSGVEVRVDTPSSDDETMQNQAYRLIGPRSLTAVPGEFEIKVQNGVLTLTGRVPRPYYRKQAERAVFGINGVREVVNLLEVSRFKRSLEVPIR